MENENDDIYDSIYMEVVELVEKDNRECEFYRETAKKLKDRFVIKRIEENETAHDVSQNRYEQIGKVFPVSDIQDIIYDYLKHLQKVPITKSYLPLNDELEHISEWWDDYYKEWQKKQPHT